MDTPSRAHDQGLNGAVAAVLRAERAALDMSLDELAERAGIPKVTVQRLLAARRGIGMQALERLAYALGMTPGAVIVSAEQRASRADMDLVERMRRGMTSVTPAIVDSGVTPVTESS